MKRIILLVAAILLVSSFIVAKTAPPADPLQTIGRQIVHAFKQDSVSQLSSLLLDEDGVAFMIDATMGSEEMQNASEDEITLTRSILEVTFALGLTQWADQFAADFDSVRAYAEDVYDIDWNKAQFINTQAEETDNGSFVFAGPVQINFSCAGDEYTLWLQELTKIEGEWRVSGFNLEITSRGAETPVFHENTTDDSWEDDGSGEEYADDSWDDAADDDSWDSDPTEDPRSKKEINQSADDSWEEE